jgi:hypothetical protein
MNRVAGGRARFVLGTAVLVVVAAACQPVTPPPPPPQPVAQACVGSTPVTPTDYQSAFDHLRLTYTEWASADGSIPIALPDGRTVWLFGDTFVGKVEPNGVIDPSDPIIHNTFVVQNGACFAPLMGGAPLARSELIPNPASGQFYWPASGIVDGSVLRVFLWHMQTTGGGLLNFSTVDMRMATFSLPSLTLQSVTPLPFTDPTHPYGATAMRGPGPDVTDVYLYGTYHDSDYVARAPLGQEANPASWVFWSGGTTWSSNPASAAPMQWTGVPPSLGQIGPGNGPAAQPSVVPYKSEFLATSKASDPFSADVSIYTAPNANGPWINAGQIADTTAPNVQAYGAFLLGATSPNPIVVYSVNTTFDTTPPPQSISNYGARFVSPSAPLP